MGFQHTHVTYSMGLNKDFKTTLLWCSGMGTYSIFAIYIFPPLIAVSGVFIFQYEGKRSCILLKTVNNINLDVLHNVQENQRVSNGLFKVVSISCFVLQVSGSMAFVIFAKSGLPMHSWDTFHVLSTVWALRFRPGWVNIWSFALLYDTLWFLLLL